MSSAPIQLLGQAELVQCLSKNPWLARHQHFISNIDELYRDVAKSFADAKTYPNDLHIGVMLLLKTTESQTLLQRACAKKSRTIYLEGFVTANLLRMI